MLINSILDNDLYKFTMSQFVFHRYPDVEVEYTFKCRSGEDLSCWADKIQKEVNNLRKLELTVEELKYLMELNLFKKDYLGYLSMMKLNPIKCVTITKNPFTLTIRGTWLETILFEVPVLAIISEIFFESLDISKKNTINSYDKLNDKIKIAIKNKFKFADFGTRRRFSFCHHQQILALIDIETLKLKNNFFNGTSNLYFAMKYDLQPVGTMAHELFMAFEALSKNLENFQRELLREWYNEYEEKLGIALTDTINIDIFLNDFNSHFSNIYQGVRQDSGDPFVIGKKIIEHYNYHKIDPKTKTIIFSDNLNFDKAAKLYNNFKDKINVSFGIGTDLTNDIEGVKPLSMVIKMSECNGKPVAKISDEPEKAQCKDEKYLKKLKETFGIK